MADMIVNYKSKDMKKAIRFTATWCGPCRAYAPIWDNTQQDYTDWEWQVVDVDKDPVNSEKYNITSIPVTVIEIEGQEVERKRGMLNKPDLKKLLDSHN